VVVTVDEADVEAVGQGVVARMKKVARHMLEESLMSLREILHLQQLHQQNLLQPQPVAMASPLYRQATGTKQPTSNNNRTSSSKYQPARTFEHLNSFLTSPRKIYQQHRRRQTNTPLVQFVFLCVNIKETSTEIMADMARNIKGKILRFIPDSRKKQKKRTN